MLKFYLLIKIMENQKPIRRNLYCEYTPEHFKMYTPCEQNGTFISIYASHKKTPIIFEWLREMYQEQWMDQYQAAVRARAVVKDFFTICQKLSKQQQRPFTLRISVLDLTLYNHGKLHLQWHRPNEGQLQQDIGNIQVIGEDDKLLNDWIWSTQVWNPKRNGRRRKNSGWNNPS